MSILIGIGFDIKKGLMILYNLNSPSIMSTRNFHIYHCRRETVAESHEDIDNCFHVPTKVKKKKKNQINFGRE